MGIDILTTLSSIPVQTKPLHVAHILLSYISYECRIRPSYGMFGAVIVNPVQVVILHGYISTGLYS